MGGEREWPFPFPSMSGGDRLGGVAAVLTLDVRDGLAQELRAHARHGVFPTPSEPEHVAGLPARGIAAPTLEQLDEPREVKPGAGADQEMRMGLQEAETHDRRPLLESDLSKVLVEKRARWRGDHGPPRQRGPREVEEMRWAGMRGRLVCSILDMTRQRSVNGPRFRYSHSQEWAQ